MWATIEQENRVKKKEKEKEKEKERKKKVELRSYFKEDIKELDKSIESKES